MGRQRCGRRPYLNGKLGAEFDHPGRGQLEIGGGGGGVAGQHGEQPEPEPVEPAGVLGHGVGFPAKEERGAALVVFQCGRQVGFHGRRHIRRFREPEPQVYRVDALTQILDAEPLCVASNRRVEGFHMHEQHALVQGLVVFQGRSASAGPLVRRLAGRKVNR